MRWTDAIYNQSAWRKTEERTVETDSLYSWAQLIGVCFGKKNAKAALKSGDAEKREITLKNGKTRIMYAMFTAASSHQQN